MTKNTNKTQKLVLGFDEVGRGPLAGPVVVAAVLTPSIAIPSDIVIRDSKKMTARQRQQSNIWITQNTIHAIGQASASDIDTIGINPSIKQAADSALQLLTEQITQPFIIIIDGRDRWFKDCQTAIKGESKYQEIAMASIIAKEYRDNLMKEMDNKFPGWEFSSHVGYGTNHHRQMIQQHGLIPDVHRRTFCTKIIPTNR